jgi:hypothetical protein
MAEKLATSVLYQAGVLANVHRHNYETNYLYFQEGLQAASTSLDHVATDSSLAREVQCHVVPSLATPKLFTPACMF